MSYEFEDAFQTYYEEFIRKTEKGLVNENGTENLKKSEDFKLHNKKDIEENVQNKYSNLTSFDQQNDIHSNSNSSLPISRHIRLKGHSKKVSALSLDPSGARMITGSHDFTVKFWDFNSMNQNFQSFRTIEPWETYQVGENVYYIERSRCTYSFSYFIKDSLFRF
jgi:WD40 repeat protein